MYLSDPIIVLVDNATPTPNEYDITEKCSSCVLNIEKPQVSGQNTYGVLAQRRELKGLWDGSVVVTLHHDYTEDVGISNVLWGMLVDDTPWTMRVRAHDNPIGVDNPEYVVPVGLSALPAVEGDPGEISASSITFQLAGVPSEITEEESA